jgi:hypothetical protein
MHRATLSEEATSHSRRAASSPAPEKCMADDTSKRGPQDRNRINVNEDYEVRYWTKELNVTKERLEEAVQAVGPMADKVRSHLQSRAKAS